MRTLFITIVVFITIAFTNCGSTPCSSSSLHYGLVGFSDAESQNIILRKFQKNSNFTNKIDTIIVELRFSRSNDTLEIAAAYSNELLVSQYDYELSFPTASRLYRINNITEEQGEIKHSIFRPTKLGCVNKITQVTINGQVTNTAKFNRFYLAK